MRSTIWLVYFFGLLLNFARVRAQSQEPLDKLLRVFGLNGPGRRERHLTPPQYMLDLYKSTADSEGVARAVNPYYATVVRSFPGDDVSSVPLHFAFNVTFQPGERILEAEFHLFKLKPKLPLSRTASRAHLLEVRVYQLLSEIRKGVTTGQESGHRLLDIRRLSTHSVGWEVFYVKPAVLDWCRDPTTNYGLLVTVSTLSGAVAEDGLLRFARRHPHHINRQPLLVVFADDGRREQGRQLDTLPAIDFHDYGYQGLSNYRTDDHQLEATVGIMSTPSSSNNTSQSRSRRATESSAKSASSPQPGSCSRHELYVDFDKIGWSDWIISPKGYHAYYCRGECSFPLGQDQWPTNHATVQSIVHQLRVSNEDLGNPCCVPNKLKGISMLYYDEKGNINLKQSGDMIAESCGCH